MLWYGLNAEIRCPRNPNLLVKWSKEALGFWLRGARVQWNETNGMGDEVLGVATCGSHLPSSF